MFSTVVCSVIWMQKRGHVRDFIPWQPLIKGAVSTSVPCCSVRGFNGEEEKKAHVFSRKSRTKCAHLDVPENYGLLGLKLKKSQSFLELLEMKLRSAKLSKSKKRKRDDADIHTEDGNDKTKASNFSASILRIGSWEIVSRREGDLVAKFYYAKRKLVWEVLESGIKNKIEVGWSDIASLKATFNNDPSETLEIELLRQPLFFRETNPQPRKHTLWRTTADFTGGQASAFRRQFLQFPYGTLWRHYNKLLQSDNKLSLLSKKPYPSLCSPFFVPESVQAQSSNADEIQGLDLQSSNTQEHVFNAGASGEYPEQLLFSLLSRNTATYNHTKLDRTFASATFSFSGADTGGMAQGAPVLSRSTLPGFYSLPASNTLSIIKSYQPLEKMIDDEISETLECNVKTEGTYDLKSDWWITKVEAGLTEDPVLKSGTVRYFRSGIFDYVQEGDKLCTELTGTNAECPSTISGFEPLSVFVFEGSEASNEVGGFVEWHI